MDDYAQYSNMMNQVNQINSQQKEIVNEKKEDLQGKLAEYKKTLEMTTEGIGGGILHDVGMNLIKKGFSAIKSKIPVPEEELESMLKDYQGGGAKKMFEGMAKRGYSKAKTKMFGDADEADAESSVKQVFGNLFKTAKAQDPTTVSSNIEDNFQEPASLEPQPPPELSQEPNFDNIGSTDEFKVQNKLLKDKFKSLDKDTQKQIQKHVNSDPSIKKSSELKDITDPDEKLAEQAKRGKALNDRVNEEQPEPPAPEPPAPEPPSIPAPLKDEEAIQDDPTKTDFQNLLDKKQGDLLKGGGLDDDDQDIFQAPRSISQKITSVLGGDEDEDLTDTIKATAKKAGEKFLETDAELGGPEDPIGDIVSGIVGIGTLLGGVFGARSKHLKGNFPTYTPINPTFQSGA